MLRKFCFALAIISLVFCPMLARADFGDEATIGGQDSSGYYRWRVNSTALFPGVNNTYAIGEPTHQVDKIYANNASLGNVTYFKLNTEVFVTHDTLTAAESGKVCVSNLRPGYLNWTLPTAAVGLQYTLVAGNSSFIAAKPQTTDTIMWLNCSTGDSIRSLGQISGDSVTLVCPSANTWVITNMGPGNFTDND